MRPLIFTMKFVCQTYVLEIIERIKRFTRVKIYSIKFYIVYFKRFNNIQFFIFNIYVICADIYIVAPFFCLNNCVCFKYTAYKYFFPVFLCKRRARCSAYNKCRVNIIKAILTQQRND